MFADLHRRDVGQYLLVDHELEVTMMTVKQQTAAVLEIWAGSA